MSVYDVLKERGFLKQLSHEDEIKELLEKEKITFYIGFDPTADSLHVGHFIALMVMSHMQRAGHRPICLLGGGTGMVGDPSGKDDMRKMLTPEFISHNIACFKKQMARFIDFSEGQAIMVNNADWLLDLNYIDFLREIGALFSVNKMLTADCYKSRMEKGLTFLEFNYMLMQAYDFLVLYKKYGCRLECGGNDQWSNILAGADLIRRKERTDAFAMTFSLLETSDGRKMGKTAKGALWLDPNKTTPYEFYQYFRNVEDVKVAECLKLLTFLDLDEIESLTKYKDERINEAKKRLAYEVTCLVHGKEEAEKAAEQAAAAFSGNVEDMPSVTLALTADATIPEIMTAAGAAGSRSEARRLIEGGGVRLNDTKVSDVNDTPASLGAGTSFVLHKGKKLHVRIELR